MNLQHRIDLLVKLGTYMLSDEASWQAAKLRAGQENSWFTPEFIDLSVRNIVQGFLQEPILQNWAKKYNLAEEIETPKTVGIVMAGNIPLVGFHDFLSVFISGHKMMIKPSSKDTALINQLIRQLTLWDSAASTWIQVSDRLKNCHAYIATGSNNSSRYFAYYFGKYPHIIRRNRTSVAILTGLETEQELRQLADDVYLYFGLGCRNVSKIYVPEQYDFVPLLEAFKKYSYLADHHKYKNNYDYNLAIHILNNQFYMTNGSVILVENKSVFSPISQLHYEYYTDAAALQKELQNNLDLQCVISKNSIPFGQAQCPAITDYADGEDTLAFLQKLK